MSSLSIFIIILILVIISNVSYIWIVFHSRTWKQFFPVVGKNDNSKLIVANRLIGFLLMGLLPLFLVWALGLSLKDYGFELNLSIQTLQLLLVMALLIIPFNMVVAPKSENLKFYPQIRKSKWTIGTFAKEHISWIAYLLGYEFLFRGVFFFASIYLIGVWPAILLNVIVYTLAHIPKGWKELVSSIPLGFALAYVTWITGNFWLAFLAHYLVAGTNSVFSWIARERKTKRQILTETTS